MSTQRYLLHFHGEETFGPLFQSIRGRPAPAKNDPVAAARPFPTPRSVRVLPQVLKLANALSVPVIVSLSNERLLRALSDPAEKKALADGASRGRILPAPTAAWSSETRVLAPFEVADEVRANLDLWRRALITPAFTLPVHAEHRFAIHDADPARVLARTPRLGREIQSIGFDLQCLENASDVEAAFSALIAALRERPEFGAAPAVAAPRGTAEKFLGDVLTSGARVPAFATRSPDAFDVGRDGFPLELARAIAPGALAERSLAPHGEALLTTRFDVMKLPAKAARGFLLRRLARAGVRDGTSHAEQARAGLLTALVMIEQTRSDPASANGEIGVDAGALCTELLVRVERIVTEAAKSRAVSDAKRAHTNATKLVAAVAATTNRTDFLAELEPLVRGAFKALEALGTSAPEAAAVAAGA